MDDKEEPAPDETGSADVLQKQIMELVTPEVYYQLRKLGRSFMQRERKNHTLQPTALVHEALFKISKPTPGEERRFNDMQHFYATCAKQMRHILVDYAKARNRDRRQYDDDGNLQKDHEGMPITTGGIDFIELDQLLKQLEVVDPHAAFAIELYYFGGHQQLEIAKITNVSEPTVVRRLRFGKAWLLTQLNRSE